MPKLQTGTDWSRKWWPPKRNNWIKDWKFLCEINTLTFWEKLQSGCKLSRINKDFLLLFWRRQKTKKRGSCFLSVRDFELCIKTPKQHTKFDKKTRVMRSNSALSTALASTATTKHQEMRFVFHMMIGRAICGAYAWWHCQDPNALLLEQSLCQQDELQDTV